MARVWNYNGYQLTARQLSELEECQVEFKTVIWRLSHGWDVDDAIAIGTCRRKYSPDDDEIVLAMLDGKIARKQAMRILQRSADSISSRAKKLRGFDEKAADDHLRRWEKSWLYSPAPTLVDGGRYLCPR